MTRLAKRPGLCTGSEHTLSRRMFLGGVVAGGGFAQLFSAAHAVEAQRRQKHVLLIFMSGGPSQFETWDPKAGQATAGPHLSIPTALPGIHFDEYMPNLARLANRLAVIRSMTTPSSDHIQAGLHTQSGHLPGPAVAPPAHWLSVCSKVLPSETKDGLPPYVMLGEDVRAFPTPGPGFLGAEYTALLCAGNGEPPRDLPAVDAEAQASLARRERLRSSISQRFAEQRPADLISAHDIAYQRMGALLNGQAAFDIAREPVRLRESYGTSGLGKDLLLARRLFEHGVSFVRVQHQRNGAWDKHRNAFRSQRCLTAEFDQAVGALVDDLIDRGLWDHTLVICMGEFGRTPAINGQGGGGRDHWSRCWSMSLGGCGIRGGVVVGATNTDGTDVRDRPVTLPDLFCTFYRALGIDPRRNLYAQGRPIPLVENNQGAVIRELI